MAPLHSHHRSLRRWVAAILLVAGWVVPLSIPHVGDDDLCVSSDGSFGAAQARISEPSAPSRPDHCLICHAARTFRTSPAEFRSVITALLPGHVLAMYRQIDPTPHQPSFVSLHEHHRTPEALDPR